MSTIPPNTGGNTDANANFNQMMQSAKTDRSAPAKSLEEVIFKAADAMVAGLGRVSGMSFIAKIGSEAILKGRAAFTDAMVVQGVPDTRGGTGAEIILGEAGLGLGSIRFDKVSPGLVETLQQLVSDVQPMSFADLGSLSPSPLPSMGRGAEGMSMMT